MFFYDIIKIMNEELLKKELEYIGLSDKEAATYLAALELGKASIQEIAKKSGVKRATTYVATEFLMHEGLMSSIQEGKKQYFMAENPERLGDFIDRRKAELEEKKKGIKRLVPELKQIHQVSDDAPAVKYYRGKEGVLAMVKSLLSFRDNEKVWIAYPLDEVDTLFTPEELQEIKFYRVNHTIKTYVLYNSSSGTKADNAVTKRILLDTEKFPFPADIAVYGENVRLTSFSGEVHGVVIKNRDIAKTLETIFKLAWERAQQIK